jgi:hypothetical protein
VFVCCECCVLSGKGLCDELITRPEESYRLWCVVVCDLETSWTKRPWPIGGFRAKNKQTDHKDPRYADNSIKQFVYSKLKLLRHHKVHNPDVWSRCATDIPHRTSAILLAVVPDMKRRVTNGTNRRLNVIAVMSKI